MDADPRAPANGVPPQLPGFRFGAVLERSHVGTAYRGFGPPGNQPVIIKVGYPGRSELRVAPEIFAQLDHPAIARLRAADYTADGEPYVAHDVAGGDPLTLAIRRLDGQYRQIAHFIRAAADALAHAHELGVTHGDISPRTLLATEDDAPLFTEFGVGLATPESARVLGLEDADADAANARERKFKVDERADLFALGAVLYFLLAGAEPTDQPLALLSDPDAPHDDIPPIDRVAPEAPTELRAICAQALSTDPVHRYLHAQNMVRDLDSYLHGKRRKPIVKVAFAVIGAALVVTFGWWGTVGGGPARIVQVEVTATVAGAPSAHAELLERAPVALTLADRFSVHLRLSKPGYVTVFYRGNDGHITTLLPAADQPGPAIEYFLPSPTAPGWHPPQPGGLGLLVIVAHADRDLATDWISGTLAGLAAPPRSFAPLLLQGRYIRERAVPAPLPVRDDDVGRTTKTFPQYATQLIRDLTARADDAVIGLMYVIEK
ncbi:MAG TPA: hypothetical protein P5572_16820 [Phycisphaerae bacterium]|nr:hypothetical protein [Phycisphaerae bacterium]